MKSLPPLEIDGFTYQSTGQPILICYPGGEMAEFPTRQEALSEVTRQQREARPRAHFARVFQFDCGAWNEVTSSRQARPGT